MKELALLRKVALLRTELATLAEPAVLFRILDDMELLLLRSSRARLVELLGHYYMRE